MRTTTEHACTEQLAQTWTNNIPRAGLEERLAAVLTAYLSKACDTKVDQCLLVIKQVFHLPLRAMSGLARSLVQLMGLETSWCRYSQVCRRQQRLEVAIPRSSSREEGLHVVMGSTGLKVFGEGEWKVRQHGYSKRRTWRKVHLGVHADTHEGVAALVTTNGVGDGEILPALLDQFDDPQLLADGAYDSHACYQAIEARGGKAVIPPCEDAVPWPVTDETPYAAQRNAALATIETHGRTAWKHAVGYHRRSLAETMYRLKTYSVPGSGHAVSTAKSLTSTRGSLR